MFIFKKNNSKAIVFKIENFTDFAFRSVEFKDLANAFLSEISLDVEIQKTTLASYAEKFLSSIKIKFKEKAALVKYIFIDSGSSKLNINTYSHNVTHGKENEHICGKMCILLSSKVVDKETMLSVAMEVIGFRYSNHLVTPKGLTIETDMKLNSHGYSKDSLFGVINIKKLISENNIFIISF